MVVWKNALFHAVSFYVPCRISWWGLWGRARTSRCIWGCLWCPFISAPVWSRMENENCQVNIPWMRFVVSLSRGRAICTHIACAAAASPTQNSIIFFLAMPLLYIQYVWLHHYLKNCHVYVFIFNVGIARQHLLCRKHQISVLFFDDSGGTRTSICKSSVLVSDFGCPTACVSLMNEVPRNQV